MSESDSLGTSSVSSAEDPFSQFLASVARFRPAEKMSESDSLGTSSASSEDPFSQFLAASGPRPIPQQRQRCRPFGLDASDLL
ncbi:hypothetical protein QR680_012689 [Steinernema hermaphroditum]|uniref:Uncharacterized protein n=1 Tax=Steinernema hermaphroditum TaxID=289476 RepID=A0AA39I458_9BILA|nr:hypothetical protein QR680_012689 [Steinernema hermaphroditum]